jgi:hypothetical protein
MLHQNTMKNILLALVVLTSFSHAYSAELTDILIKRGATFEERQSVSEKLAQLGKLQPLKVADAIAEVCYGIDVCAGLTKDSQFPAYCSDDNEGTALGGECYPKYFRNKYSCNTDIEKQSNSMVTLAGKILLDINILYSSYIYEYMIDGFSKQYNVDLRELAKDPAALEEFMQKNPHAKLRIQTISKENVALAAYTLDCYDSLNRLLYAQVQSKITRYYNLYKAVINTMDLFPEFKGVVNRGARLPSKVLEEHHKIGNIVCYNGFTSTAIHDPKTDMSDKPRNTFLMGRCTQRLYITYDERAIGGRNISKGSAHKHEDEILFEPGACFRIDKVYERTDPPMEEEWEMECAEGEHYNFEMTLVR